MATFESRVEGLTGLSIDGSSSPTQDELSLFLRDGVRDVQNRTLLLRPQEAYKFQKVSAIQDANDTLSVHGDVISVLREAEADGSSDGSTAWRVCREIPAALQSRAVDVNSLHYASKFNPVWMRNDRNKINVYPAPDGTNDGFKVYSVNATPAYDEGTDALLLYSDDVIKYFPQSLDYLVVIFAGIRSLQNAISTRNTSLSELTDIPSIALDVSNETLPNFTTPASFVMPSIPSDVELDFTSITSPSSFVEQDFAAPTLPTISAMTLPDAPSVPDIVNNSVVLPSGVPTFKAPSTAPNYADADNWINVEEDNEMLVSRMQVINANLTQYNADIQKAVQEMNKENIEYQAKLQKAMQDAQLSQADDGQKIQKFSAEVSIYTAQVTKEVQRYQNEEIATKFNEWTQTYQSRLAEFNNKVQQETTRTSSSLSIFNAEVGKVLQEYGAETGYDISRFQQEVQAQVQRYQNDLTTNSADFDKNLSKFTADFQKVNSDNSSKITKYGSDIQNYSAKISKIKTDYDFMTQRLIKLQQDYDAAFAIMQPRQKQQQGG